MGSILPFLRKTGIALDDHGTKAIGEAFDAACIALHDSGQPQIVYEPRAASGMSIACGMLD
jgi:hypothetical protein